MQNNILTKIEQHITMLQNVAETTDINAEIPDDELLHSMYEKIKIFDQTTLNNFLSKLIVNGEINPSNKHFTDFNISNKEQILTRLIEKREETKKLLFSTIDKTITDDNNNVSDTTIIDDTNNGDTVVDNIDIENTTTVDKYCYYYYKNDYYQ